MAKLPEIISDVEACLDADSPVWLWGKPGVGKSEAIAQIAAQRRKAQLAALMAKMSDGERVTLGDVARASPPVVDIRLSTFDPVDLRGLPAIINGLTKWLRPAIWPVDNAYGLETILFFDEMDRAAPAVANAALQIVLDRKIGEHVLPACVRIVAAGNGSTDRGTTTKIGKAQANRFTHLYVEADAESAAQHWNACGYDPALPAFIRFRGAPTPASAGQPAKPGLLETEAAEGEHGFGSPRAWAECNKFMPLSDAQRHRLVAGRVGKAPAGEFEAFIRMFRSLPSIAEIVRNPTGAAVSNELNVNYAVATALARKADHSNMAAIVTYAGRLPREFGIMLITDATRRDRSLCETRALIDWHVANQDVEL